MSLRHSPLLFVFYDIAGLDRQRELLESAIGFPVIEVEAHLPHERHGVVKYDGGTLIPSLNLSTPGKFHDDASDALVAVVDVPASFVDSAARRQCRVTAGADGEIFTDPWGHHYVFRRAGGNRPVVSALRLAVDDVAESVAFYRDGLDLPVLSEAPGEARIGTASTTIVLEERDTAVDGRALNQRTVLLVFYARPIEAMRETLIGRGVAFSTRRVAYSRIGGTTRFEDPAGHRFCLYEPSDASLTWGSAEKVLSLAADGAAAG